MSSGQCECRVQHIPEAKFCAICGKRLPYPRLDAALIRRAIKETREHGHAFCVVAKDKPNRRVKIFEFIPGQDKAILGAVDYGHHWAVQAWRATGLVNRYRTKYSQNELIPVEVEG